LIYDGYIVKKNSFMKLHCSKYLWVPALWIMVFCTHNSQQNSSSVSIHTDFEGGKVGNVKQRSATQWELALEGEDDWENRNRQVSWYYFRIEGAKDQSLTLDLTDLVGEYNYNPGSHAITSETRPMISYDQKHWQHLTDEEVEWDEEKVEPSPTAFRSFASTAKAGFALRSAASSRPSPASSAGGRKMPAVRRSRASSFSSKARATSDP
jgi:hypothetical protein